MTQNMQHSNDAGLMPTTATTSTQQPRIRNPASLLPDAMQGIQTLIRTVYKSGVSPRTLELCHLRASQINGCHLCIEYGLKQAREGGESEERLGAIAAWQDAGLFSEAERAALSLTESVTRLADSVDPVPDAIWKNAARHYDERELAALVLWVAVTNTFNRLNVSTRQVAADWS